MNPIITSQLRTYLHGTDLKSNSIKLFLAFVGAYLTAISAQIAVPLPFTPVPITTQVFVVMVLACLLGPMYGGLSQIIYLSAGAAGLPWYAGGLSGLHASITAGYIVGFVAAAIIVGVFSRHQWFQKSSWRLGLAMLIGLAFIYLFGIFHLYIVTGGPVMRVIQIGVVPFIIPDLIKIFLASKLVARTGL